MWHRTAIILTVAVVFGSTGAMAQNRSSEPVASIERLDPRFDAIVPSNAKLEKLADGFSWSEGPVWNAADSCVLFSDVPNNVVMKWKSGDGLSQFLKPSGQAGAEPRGGQGGSNGLALDARGRLVLCQHGDRCIARLEKDGRFTTLADRWQGKRLNSPNDLVFKSNGDLYFTDPTYGLPKRAADPTREIDFAGVYRLSTGGEVSLMTKDLTFPNGIGFSPDEKTLYVSQSDSKRPIWMAYAVKEDGALGPGRVFCDPSGWPKTLSRGSPDGLKVDRSGNLFATGPGGVTVFAPDGTVLGRINPGASAANCCFGDDGSVLYITAHQYLFRIQTKTKGISF